MSKDNKPAKRQESQPPQKEVGSSNIQPGSIGLDISELGQNTDFDPLTRRYVLAQQTTMSGPLPHSVEFAGYENALPGAANRILKMAEEEQQARLVENQRRLTHDGWNIIGSSISNLIGQGAAIGLVMLALHYSYDLALHEQTTAAVTITGTTVGAILTAFLRGKGSIPSSRPQSKEEDK